MQRVTLKAIERKFPYVQVTLKSLTFFLLSVVYSILRPLKLSLIVAAPGAGAEVIPFLKVWVVLPAAMLFTWLFTWLMRRYTREHVFYIITAIFFSFFTLFTFVLYPQFAQLQTTKIEAFLMLYLPSGLQGFAAMIRLWPYSLFYVFAELWGSIVLSLLFWGFINEVTAIKQAKKNYGLYALAANCGMITAGLLGCNSNQLSAFFSTYKVASNCDTGIICLLNITLLCIIAAIVLFYLLNRPLKRSLKQHQNSQPRPTKAQLSLTSSLTAVFSSLHLRAIATVVLSYNLVFNLLDIMFSDQLRVHFGENLHGIKLYISQVTLINGCLGVLFAVITPIIMTKLGWLVTAMTTPIIVGLTSGLLFAIITFGDNLPLIATSVILGLPATLAIGMFQNATTRAAKYTLFDASKEMAFIPLSKTEQRKGKAIIDGLTSRIGKSGGSIIYQILLLFFSSITATLPIIMVIVVIFIISWVLSVLHLDQKIKAR